MKQQPAASRRLRRIVGAACLGTLVFVPAADAATKAKPRPKPAKLVVSSLQSPPAKLASGASFTVRGRVKNVGGRTAPALIALNLRAKSSPKLIYTLKGVNVKAVKPGRTVSFSTRVTPQTLTQDFPTGFLLQACVKTARGSATTACRKAAGRVVVAAKAVGKPPVLPAPVPVDPNPNPNPKPEVPPVEYVSGARTLGDELYTTIGNGGYDVQHYDLDLDYKAPPNDPLLKGTATITALTTENLKDFSLDFQGSAEYQGLNVSSVKVDGELARHESDTDHNKLIVFPQTPVLAGKTITIEVKYGGTPEIVVDPDGDLEGWITSKTWGAVALGEPVGSQGWFPVNNIPDDKATFDITVTTDDPFSAMSNGDLISKTTAAPGRTTYHWREGSPMTPYLATVSVANFGSDFGPDLSDPLRPFYVGVDASVPSPTRETVINGAKLNVPKQLDFYASYYGVPYPFSTAGGILPRVDQGFGYILETQSKPTYPAASVSRLSATSAASSHENAHMWWGDLVTLKRWKDIWLNEGFATFSANLYTEQGGGQTTQAKLDSQYMTSSTSFWRTPTANPPTAGDIFDNNAMYTRGSMVVASIRILFGEERFKALLHDWLVDHSHGNVTTPEFIAAVKKADPVPGREARWDEFFKQWLYTSYTGSPAAGNKPQMTYANFDTYALAAR